MNYYLIQTQIKIFVYIYNLLVERSHEKVMDHFCLSQDFEGFCFVWFLLIIAGVLRKLEQSPSLELQGKSNQLGPTKHTFTLNHDSYQA